MKSRGTPSLHATGAEQVYASNDYDSISQNESDKALWDSQCADTPAGIYNVLAEQGGVELVDGKAQLTVQLCDFAGILTSATLKVQASQARIRKYITFECTMAAGGNPSNDEVFYSFDDPVCSAGYTPISSDGLSFPADGLGNIGKDLEVPTNQDLVPFEVSAGTIRLSNLGVTQNFSDIVDISEYPCFMDDSDASCPVIEVVRTADTGGGEETRLFFTKAKDSLGKDIWQAYDITSWPDSFAHPEVVRIFVHCSWFARAEDTAVSVAR